MTTNRLFYCLLFSILFSFASKADKVDTALRANLYNLGIQATIHHYDSLLINISQQRKNKKLGEELFLENYASYRKQYENRHEPILAFAEYWAKDDNVHSKNIKKALGTLAKGNTNEAFQMMDKKLADKSIDPKNKADFSFQADLANYLALEKTAINCYKNLAQSPLATANDYTKYATTLGFYRKDSLADVWFQKAIQKCGTDTLSMLLATQQKAKTQYYREETNEAAATLIAAQYLIEHYTQKTAATRKVHAEILIDLAGIQLQQSNFDNALPNAKAAIKLITQNPENDRQALLTTAKHTLAMIYQKAGGNEHADTLYQQLSREYPPIVSAFPQKYLPKYADMLEHFATVQRWFDKLEDLEKNLSLIAIKRTELAKNNYPPFLLQLAEHQKTWGHKTMDLDVKVFIAQEKWLTGKEALLKINQKNPMLYGPLMCLILDKLGSIEVILKKPKEASPIFEELFALQQQLYELAPSQNKSLMMVAFIQMGTVNAMNNKKELSLSQLDKAIEMAREMGEKSKVDALSTFREKVANKE